MHGARSGWDTSDKSTTLIATTEMQQRATHWKTWARLVPRLTFVVLAGMLSFCFLIILTHTLLNMDLPRSLQQVQLIAAQLDDMTHGRTWSDYFCVVVVFASIYLWQQGFSMPGSILLNLLAGQLYGVITATLWTSYLTAFGSTLAYFLGWWVIGPPVLEVPWVKRRVELWQEQMDREKKAVGLFWWLLFIRLLPFSPYWFINMVSPLVGVPLAAFFWSTFLGSMPYNYVCAQAGEVLGELTTTSDLLTVSLMGKLLVVSLVSLIPLIWGKSMQRRMKKRMEKDDEDLDIELEQ